MEPLLIETYTRSIMAKAAKILQSLKNIQLMEMKLMSKMAIGDRLKISGKFIPWYVLYCIFNETDQKINEKYIAIAHDGIIEDDEYEQLVLEECKKFTKKTIDELNNDYIKQLVKQNIQGKDILTLTNELKIFDE